jgi:hypothetical protein
MAKYVAARTTTNGVQYYDETEQAFLGIASGAYTVTSESRIIDLNPTLGSRQITLPALAGIDQGRFVTVKDGLGTADQDNPITIIPSGSDAIDGIRERYVLAAKFGTVTLVSTSVGWSVTSASPTVDSIAAQQLLRMDSASALDEAFDERTLLELQQ